MTRVGGRLAGDVAAGDRLPPFEVDVSARTVIMGASASRDWQPQHHDHAWAVNRAGTRDIFLNTPTQAGWIERYLTDWSGPLGRLGRLGFRMRRPICVGDRMTLAGTVAGVSVDDHGCHWADVSVEVTVDGVTATECTARLALPSGPGDSPWLRDAAAWHPDPD